LDVSRRLFIVSSELTRADKYHRVSKIDGVMGGC